MKAAKRSLIEREIENMLPEEVWNEKILLKLPANTLSNLRYVSKYFWNLITNPSFVKLHLSHSTAQLNNHLLLISSQEIMYEDDRPHRLKTSCIQNYVCSFPWPATSSSNTEIVEIHCPFEHTDIRASCNGLLYLHRRSMIDDTFRNYIWNPCTREIKVLPPPPPNLLLSDLDVDDDDDVVNYIDGDFQPSDDGWDFCSSSGFCGFGYDRANDQYKVLRYENRIHSTSHNYKGDGVFPEINLVTSIIEFKLHTLGTNNTWRSIDDNPYKSFFFREPCKRMGLLVNGALHWIMRPSGPPTDISTKIIAFDMEKEVFREIQKPALYYPDNEKVLEKHLDCCESIQVLEECLCICEIHLHGEHVKIDIWMLQDYDVMDSWTKLLRVVIPNEDEFDYYEFRLLRYCENGEIVMSRTAENVVVYDPVNHKTRCAKKFKQVIEHCWQYFLDYTESLVSLSLNSEFKLHTLGTNNTWRSIDDNLYKSFFFCEPCKRIGLLVNGALHWIMRPSNPPTLISTKIISFDMEKEVFREIQKPALYYPDKEKVPEEHPYCCESIQVLEECLCICEIHLHGEHVKIDIWMLQDYDVMDSWTKLFRVVIPNEEEFYCYEFILLRYCENGEILMLRNVKDVIVYDLVNQKTKFAKKFDQVVEHW